MVASRLEQLDREIHWRHCALSVEYFAENFCFIKHPEKGAIKIPLRPEQREVVRLWEGGRNTVSLKARQIGWSTMVCIFVMWFALFRPSSEIVLLSKKQEDARDLIEKCDYLFRRLPDWMRDRVDRTNRSVDSIKLNNDSKVSALPSKKDPARSKTASLLVLDEWAFYDDPENAWAAIEPAIDVGGQCIALSTANGMGNFFHNFYVAAKKKLNGFVPLFYSWRVVPERDDDWYAKQKVKLPPWQLAQEYPDDDIMAFVSSGMPAFESDKLMALQREDYRRGWLSEVGHGIEFTENANGMVHILRDPEPHKTYAIGADVAEGRATGDFSAASVLDTETGEQVARWHGHMNVDLYADELYRLGQFYNWALLGPERNSVGAGCIARLNFRLKYPNLHYERKQSTVKKDKKAGELGWHTNPSSKARLVLGLNEGIRDGTLIPTHVETIEELTAFRQKPDGGWEGIPNDDEVIALGIAWQLLPLALPSGRPDRDAPVQNSWSVNAVLAEMDRANSARGRRGKIGSQ